MPKGYVIGHITVNDPDAYREYVERDTPIIEKHGGTPLVRGGDSITQEGPEFSRHVVFEFPTYEAALALYNDPDYQEVMKIRQRTADSMIVVAKGV